MYAFFVFIFGLLFGSFGNSVVYRTPAKLLREWRDEARAILGLPREEPEEWLDSSRSFCPQCHHSLKWYDLVPLFSWLSLKGQCRYCQAPIPARYPLLELGGALLALLAYIKFGLTLKAAVVFAALLLLLWLTVIDIGHMLLPDTLVYPLLWLGLLASTQNIVTSAHQAVYGAAVGYGILAVPAYLFSKLTSKEGMGGGDFKLLAAIGAFVGPLGAWAVMFLAALSSVVLQLSAVATGKLGKSEPMPFGPSLACAGAVLLLWRPELAAWLANHFHIII